jgi:hypothetical protein
VTPEQIFTALAKRDGFPRDAMIAAGTSREEMVPIFLDQIDRLQSKTVTSNSDPDVSAFLFSYFLLGEWRDTRAYRPLTALLHRNIDELDFLIGDAVTEGTARVIAGVFDGDLQPIFSVLEDSAAYDFVRGQMIDALVMIARAYPDKAPEVAACMERFFEAGFEKPDVLWESWAFAVAELALAHLEPLVRKAYERGWIDPGSSSFEHFQRDLKDAVETGNSSWYHNSRNTRLIESAVDELSGWYCFSDDYLNGQPRADGSGEILSQLFSDTFERETPKVGRNDPCPCGSGKKYKKCCLH